LSADICCGTWRIAASTSAHVSSAAAYDGVPGCPLAYQDQRFGIPQPFGQRIDVLDMIVPDLDLVAGQLLEALERAKRVMIIVQNRDLHS
jgi:hypothetical protein